MENTDIKYVYEVIELSSLIKDHEYFDYRIILGYCGNYLEVAEVIKSLRDRKVVPHYTVATLLIDLEETENTIQKYLDRHFGGVKAINIIKYYAKKNGIKY